MEDNVDDDTDILIRQPLDKLFFNFTEDQIKKEGYFIPTPEERFRIHNLVYVPSDLEDLVKKKSNFLPITAVLIRSRDFIDSKINVNQKRGFYGLANPTNWYYVTPLLTIFDFSEEQ